MSAVVKKVKPARLNPQGLARKQPDLMQCIIPDPGYTTVSIDLSAGEPSVVSHYSQDPMYTYAVFGGVGKAPYYHGAVMMIADPYIMGMSISPVGAATLREAWERKWPAGSFADQWLADAEVIKGYLKKYRAMHKAMILGTSYGMGAATCSKTLYEQGYTVSVADCKKFIRGYWQLMAGIRKFADQIARRLERDKYIINDFGFRGIPDPFRGFNWWCQSSVSGVMHVFTAKVMAAAPYSRYVTLVHDELLIDTPTDMLQQFKLDKERATQSLNDDLQWSIDIRTGFAPGQSWFEAK